MLASVDIISQCQRQDHFYEVNAAEKKLLQDIQQKEESEEQGLNIQEKRLLHDIQQQQQQQQTEEEQTTNGVF